MPAFTLPPASLIAGVNTQGPAPVNPTQHQNIFYTDPTTGEGLNVGNAENAVSNFAIGGNPLNYGQTASYTGPSGNLDSPTMQNPVEELMPIEEAVGQKGMYNMGDIMQLNNAAQKGNPWTAPDVYSLFTQLDDGSFDLAPQSGNPYSYMMYDENVPLHDLKYRSGQKIGKQGAMNRAMAGFSSLDEIESSGGDGSP